ncbi:DUF4097 family beta strand repeat-containing protein [Phytoactinopolyspora limicola]|uniref:DUF4097 family beta strand repeat-containing protein n=1 Tax=Phytoactinopolyspora limicola TaxID=2715536 RepID=UPI00140D547B|nr:DUF4097 family beta strand repeat-containing protein [Phytoactinopolyspora limicola]
MASTFPRTFPAPNPLALSINSRAGRVEVNAADVTEAKVDIQPSVPGDEDAWVVIEHAIVHHQDDELLIDLSQKDAGPSLLPDLQLDIVVVVPHDSLVSVRTGSASIQAGGGLGNCSLNTGSGDVAVSDAQATSVKTGSGDIRIAQVTSAEVNSGSGDVHIQGCSGRIDANTASGDLKIDDIVADGGLRTASGDVEISTTMSAVEIQTASGDVRVRHMTQGSLGAKTASGDITAGVAVGTVAKLDCSTVSGRVRSELDETSAPDSSEPTATISARAVSGSIAIIRSHSPLR